MRHQRTALRNKWEVSLSPVFFFIYHSPVTYVINNNNTEINYIKKINSMHYYLSSIYMGVNKKGPRLILINPTSLPIVGWKFETIQRYTALMSREITK